MKPTQGESEKDFMARCLADKTMTQDTCALAWKGDSNNDNGDEELFPKKGKSSDVAVDSLSKAIQENFSKELEILAGKMAKNDPKVGESII